MEKFNQRSGLTFNKSVPRTSKGYLGDGTEIEAPTLENQLFMPFAWVDHEEPHD